MALSNAPCSYNCNRKNYTNSRACLPAKSRMLSLGTWIVRVCVCARVRARQAFKMLGREKCFEFFAHT